LTLTKYRTSLQRGQFGVWHRVPEIEVQISGTQVPDTELPFHPSFRHFTCEYKGMTLYDRLTRYHSESRPSFILFTEFIAFVGTMTTMVGIGFLRELLG